MLLSNLENFTCISLIIFIDKNCSTDIDECAPKPCKHGATCSNLIGRYECNCTEDFTGTDCQYYKDICATVKPCSNGASCHLVDNYDYHCACPAGFMGRNCTTSTTASFLGLGIWDTGATVNSNFSFSFITTLPNVFLARMKHKSKNFDLYFSNHILYIKSSDKAIEREIAHDMKLTDGHWHKITVSLAENYYIRVHVDKQKCVHSNCSLPSETNPLTFTNVLVGGGGSKSNFTGCMQDVMSDGAYLVPSENGKLIGNVTAGKCSREESLCEANPCNKHGICDDFWTRYECRCYRQYYGKHCESGWCFFSSCISKSQVRIISPM